MSPPGLSEEKTKVIFDLFNLKERAPHIAEEPKCIDAAHRQYGKADSQPQETGILPTQAQLLQMPAMDR